MVSPDVVGIGSEYVYFVFYFRVYIYARRILCRAIGIVGTFNWSNRTASSEFPRFVKPYHGYLGVVLDLFFVALERQVVANTAIVHIVAKILAQIFGRSL